MQIALELEPFKLSLVNNVDSMVRFLDDVNHPAVKANIDVSHLQLSDTKPEELRRLKGKAIHVHISDCDGKVHGDLPPGRGVVDFGPYLREIKALGIDGAVSIELEYSPRAGQDRRLGARGVPGDGPADAAGGAAGIELLRLRSIGATLGQSGNRQMTGDETNFENLSSLVEHAQRQAKIERVDQLLLEGLASGPGEEATAEWAKTREEWRRGREASQKSW